MGAASTAAPLPALGRAARGLPIDLAHLDARLRQTGHWTGNDPLTEAAARFLLVSRINELDWRKAVQDVLPFIRDTRAVEAWDKDLFLHVAGRLTARPGRGFLDPAG